MFGVILLYLNFFDTDIFAYAVVRMNYVISRLDIDKIIYGRIFAKIQNSFL